MPETVGHEAVYIRDHEDLLGTSKSVECSCGTITPQFFSLGLLMTYYANHVAAAELLSMIDQMAELERKVVANARRPRLLRRTG